MPKYSPALIPTLTSLQKVSADAGRDRHQAPLRPSEGLPGRCENAAGWVRRRGHHCVMALGDFAALSDRARALGFDVNLHCFSDSRPTPAGPKIIFSRLVLSITNGTTVLGEASCDDGDGLDDAARELARNLTLRQVL